MAEAAGPGAETARDEATATRYRAYERVFRVLSERALADGGGETSHELSYRQHVAVETLRDIELTRRRYLLLHPVQVEADDAVPSLEHAGSAEA